VAARDTDIRDETQALHARLAEAEDTLRAIRHGEIDALVVEGPAGSRIYTLHSADEPYRMLVEEMHEGAVVLTSSGDVLYANRRFAALAGEPLESVVGSCFDRFLNPADRREFGSLLRSGSGWRRCSLIGSGSGEFDVRLSLSTTSPASGAQLNLVVTDLTQLLEANSGRERAERESRTKDEFLTLLAHELRTPLGAIANASYALERAHAGDESAARMHEIIARQVLHVSRLVDDLLDVERVVAGKIRLDRRPLEIAAAVRRAVAICAGDPSSDLRISVSTEPLWVDADADRLQQVLTNLLGNAMKYTPSGGCISVTVCADGGDAVITVEDSGLGISPKLLPFVFDMYVQSDRTLDRARGGLGIGLALVRRLIELHGGTVSAASDGEGCGSTITVRLKQLSSAAKSSSVSFPAARAESKRVLLIEDNAESRELLGKVLELAGHQVYDAADGVRGLELLNVVYPEVGIIDIGLPHMDGYEVAKRIRARPQGRAMLLVGLTDGSGGSKRVSGGGFDHHLVRPVDLDHLGRLISPCAEAS
jgi:two-component system, sensor histidine kinase